MIQQITDNIYKTQTQSSGSAKDSGSGFSALIEAVSRNTENVESPKHTSEVKAKDLPQKDNSVKENEGKSPEKNIESGTIKEKENKSPEKEIENNIVKEKESKNLEKGVESNIKSNELSLEEQIRNMLQILEGAKQKIKELQEIASENKEPLEQLSEQLAELIAFFQIIGAKLEKIGWGETPEAELQKMLEFLNSVDSLCEKIAALITPDLAKENVDVHQKIIELIAEAQELLPKIMPDTVAKNAEVFVQENTAKPIIDFNSKNLHQENIKDKSQKTGAENVSLDAEESLQNTPLLQKDTDSKTQNSNNSSVIDFSNKITELAKSTGFLNSNTPQPDSNTQNSGNNIINFTNAGQTVVLAKGEAVQNPYSNLQHSQNIIEQTTLLIQRSVNNGTTKMSLQLSPAELGKVTVNLNFSKTGSVTGVIYTDNPQTLALLQRDARILEQSLQNAGLQINTGDLSFSFDNNNNGNVADDFFQKNKSKENSSETAEAGEQTIEQSDSYIITPDRINIRV